MRDLSPRKMKITGIGCLVIGVLVLIGLVKTITDWKIFCSDPITVSSVVVGNEKNYDIRGRSLSGIGVGKGSSYYYPYVCYEVGSIVYEKKLGVDVLMDAGISSFNAPFDIGSEITLTVDANDPARVLASSNRFTLFNAVGGPLAICIGVLNLRMAQDPERFDRLLMEWVEQRRKRQNDKY